MGKALSTALSKNLSVLFVNIGWAWRYDGTEPVVGNQSHLKWGESAFEAEAFERDEEGLFRCGLGDGRISEESLHVVYVAVDQDDGVKKVVGIYADARVVDPKKKGDWQVVSTRHAVLIPVGRRPAVAVWPGRSGLRRWAASVTDEHTCHPTLLRQFRQLARNVSGGGVQMSAAPGLDDESGAHEGEEVRRLVRHRRREAKLRRAKIQQTLRANDGRLTCEVRNCGFDFQQTYGTLGAGYAQVHHLDRLNAAPKRGRWTDLERLAIVCANCHAMIHRGGGCRPMKGLIPE